MLLWPAVSSRSVVSTLRPSLSLSVHLYSLACSCATVFAFVSRSLGGRCGLVFSLSVLSRLCSLHELQTHEFSLCSLRLCAPAYRAAFVSDHFCQAFCHLSTTRRGSQKAVRQLSDAWLKLYSVCVSTWVRKACPFSAVLQFPRRQSWPRQLLREPWRWWPFSQSLILHSSPEQDVETCRLRWRSMNIHIHIQHFVQSDLGNPPARSLCQFFTLDQHFYSWTNEKNNSHFYNGCSQFPEDES